MASVTSRMGPAAFSAAPVGPGPCPTVWLLTIMQTPHLHSVPFLLKVFFFIPYEMFFFPSLLHMLFHVLQGPGQMSLSFRVGHIMHPSEAPELSV